MIIGNCNFCKKKYRKREQKYKFCSLKCANNFNRNGLKQTTLPHFSTKLAEFIGICLGDGYVSKYQTAITLNSEADKKYIPYVIRLSKKLFPNIHISVIKRKNENAADIRLSSKIVAEFILKMGLKPNNKTIPEWIYSKEKYKYACIRGLYDTEGSISFKTYKSKLGISIYRQLNFKNADKNFILFVRDSLIKLGIKPTMSLKKSLYISNEKDLVIFKNTIGFNNPKLKLRADKNLQIALQKMIAPDK